MLFKRMRIREKGSDRMPAGHMDVTQLDIGDSARVVGLSDGGEIINKLEAMGIVPGSVIRKKSAIPAKGPIILEKELVQFAVGYEMAQKIIVEQIEPGTGSGI